MWTTQRPRRGSSPAKRHEFPVTVKGQITGGRDTPGHRRIDTILYLNDRWNSTAVAVIRE